MLALTLHAQAYSTPMPMHTEKLVARMNYSARMTIPGCIMLEMRYQESETK